MFTLPPICHLLKMPQPPDLASLRLDHDHTQDQDSQESRHAALRKELENVKSVNRVVEGVIESLQKAKGNMNVRTILSV